MFLRQLHPGERFILKRTGEVFTYIRCAKITPGGIKYIVLKDGAKEVSTLHHSCKVEPTGC